MNSKKQEIDELVKNDSFLLLSKKSLTTLERLINQSKITPPVEAQVLIDIAIGAVAESQAASQIHIVDVLHEHKEFIFDSIFFDTSGEYTLHDVLAQIICFRLVKIMEEFLEHLNVEYASSFS